MLRGYKRKTKPANWQAAFPEQAISFGGKTADWVFGADGSVTKKPRKPARVKKLENVGPCDRCGAWRKLDEHHTRGRAGSLRDDPRFKRNLCRDCHRWVHDHPEAAREGGWFCAVGSWNTPPKEK